MWICWKSSWIQSLSTTSLYMFLYESLIFTYPPINYVQVTQSHMICVILCSIKPEAEGQARCCVCVT